MAIALRNSAKWTALGLLTACVAIRDPRSAAQLQPQATLLARAASSAANHPPEGVGAKPSSLAAGPNEGAASGGALSESMPPSNETLHIVMGHSLMLRSATPLRRIYIGNPTVLQSYTVGQNEVVLTPKQGGVSSLIVWDTSGGELFYTVSADFDPQNLRASLREAFPGSSITAETHDGKIYLTGTAANQAASDAAAKLAQLFASDIVNSIRVSPAAIKQVELKLRIVEVDRTKLDQLGMNIFSGGSNAIATSTQQYSTGPTGIGTSTFAATDPLNLLFYNFSNAIGASVKALQQHNVLEVLAEPTLTTISGVPARFLSGGEFPVPVVQGGIGTTAAVTIIFRPYGVKVDFTPTVLDDGSIRLKVAPEVSTLDYSNAVTISGFTIPALSTRRAETEVQIRDGQTFLLSGLLDHRTTDQLSRIPGISSVPVLGEMFKSKNMNHSTTEMVLIVTATVVDPLVAAPPVEPAMATPLMQSKGFDTENKSKPVAAGTPSPRTDKP